MKSRPKRKKTRKVYQSGQPFTKKYGKKGSQVPVPQQLRIMNKYIRGMSIRQIAEDEDRARQTVAKIVQTGEVQEYITKLRAEVIGLGDEAVKSLRHGLKNELDGRLAYQLLKDIGAIQSSTDVQANPPQPTQRQEEELTEEWIRRIHLLALEKSIVYGTTPPPPIEQAMLLARGN
jgi:hypothetical protein